jgi:hypothetical protein
MTIETGMYVSLFPDSEISELTVLRATMPRDVIAAVSGSFKGNNVNIY